MFLKNAWYVAATLMGSYNFLTPVDETQAQPEQTMTL